MKRVMQFLKENRGGSMVEFAVTTPILLLLMAGAGDFARLFFSAISLKSGSAVGAFYGSQVTARSGDVYGMTTRALADTEDAARFNAVTASVNQVCQCPGQTAFACGEYQATTCPAGYGSARAYVRVVTEQDFKPMTPFPGIPETVNIDQGTWMRVR